MIYLAATADMVTEICKSPSVMVNQTKVAAIPQPQLEVIEYSFADANKAVQKSKPLDQESLLLRPVSVKQCHFILRKFPVEIKIEKGATGGR